MVKDFYIKNKNKIMAFIFPVVLTLILSVSSSIVSPEGGEVYDIVNTDKKLEDLALEDKDSIDVMFTGNSLVFRDISPLQIYHEHGISSYDVSDGAMRLCDQCSILRTAYKRHTPDLIVIEPCVMFSEASPYRDAFAHPTNFVESLFPIFHYHTFYKAYIPSIFDSDDNELDEDDVDGMKGFQYSEKVEPYTGDLNYMEKDRLKNESEIHEDNLYYLKKITDFAEANGVKLLVTALPSPVNYDRSRHDSIQKWAEENGVDFIDLNLLTDEMGIDWATDTKDGGDHLNLSGSKKVSAYLGNYIAEHYSLKDHRDEESFKDWSEAADKCGLYD